MRRRLVPLLVASLACGIALLAAGCVYHHHEPVRAERAGPPPWAPAHGYRHKHSSGVELVFDSGLGVYVVVGQPQLWFYHDHFYRLRGGEWWVAAGLSGPWRGVSSRRLPTRLRQHYTKKTPPGQAKKKAHGHVPANRRD